MRSSTSLSACTPPKRMETPSISRTGTHASSLRRSARIRIVLEGPTAQPSHERTLLLGDAPGEHRERQQQEQSTDGGFPGGRELREREDVEVGVRAVEERREHGEQDPALHHPPPVAGAADHRHEEE